MKILKDPAARILTVACISAGTLGATPGWYVVLAVIVYAVSVVSG
jgi:hypothetical protein